ncbi:MAG: hypothetical protein KBI32_12420 [Phycisphaerae bacterium]|nr:hypothetical protein [Phycisphaerae bacterium]
MRIAIILSIVIGFVGTQADAARGRTSGVWRIEKQGGNWRLLRDDQPFYIKGAVGWQAYDLLRQSGGNAIRTGSNRGTLDKVHEAGLVAMVNLPVRGERNGMNWDDEQMVSQQKQRVLQTVREVKDHPAVMCWAVGNELDWIPPGAPYNPRLWRRLNDIAAEIHAIDPNHPVMTVIGDSQYERKIQEIARDCTDMDLLGINSYGNIATLADLTRKHWPKPYVAAEWGPTGHWQTPKTAWGMPTWRFASDHDRPCEYEFVVK